MSPIPPFNYRLMWAEQKERAEKAERERDALKQIFGPLLDEADWHAEGCDCAGCVWFEKARHLLQLIPRSKEARNRGLTVTAPTKAERLEAAMKERDAFDAKYQPEWYALNAKHQAEWDALYARIRAIEAEP